MKAQKKRVPRVLGVALLLFTLWGCAARHSANDYKVVATAWQASSAEVVALYEQGFAIAKNVIDARLRKGKPQKPFAITTDIDQTVLDTAGYTAWQLKTGLEYPDGWAEYVLRESATPTPGSVEFLQYVDQKGIAIFYVTNRKEKFRDPTIRNLKKYGYPQIVNERMFFRTMEKGKTEWYAQISETHEIIAMLGDNLADFDESFDEGTNDSRNERVAKMRGEFGRKYIIFPNAMYGGWERALLDHKNVSVKEKGKILFERTIPLEK